MITQLIDLSNSLLDLFALHVNRSDEFDVLFKLLNVKHNLFMCHQWRVT